jgi:hypothetical protein
MSEETIISLIEKKGDQMRSPFVPLTGNPENHCYADWADLLRQCSKAPADIREKSRPES